MVSVVQLHPQSGAAALGPLAEGLAGDERALGGVKTVKGVIRVARG